MVFGYINSCTYNFQLNRFVSERSLSDIITIITGLSRFVGTV